MSGDNVITGHFLFIEEKLLFHTVTVTAHELINTTGSVNQLRLTCVERVRGAGDFQLYQRISFTFEFDSLFRVASGTRQEYITI